jgi:hypothetical protein
VPARAAADEPQPPPKRAEAPRPLMDSLGLSLGPIGMTLGGGRPPAEPQAKGDEGSLGSRLAGAAGVSLGPIALSLGASVRDGAPRDAADADADAAAAAEAVRLNSLSSQEWQQTFVRPGAPAPRACDCCAPRLSRLRRLLRAQTTRWTCGWRTTSTRRRACRLAARTARARTWRGPARRARTRAWRCTPCASRAQRQHSAAAAVPKRAHTLAHASTLPRRLQRARQRRGVHRVRRG